MFGQQHQPNPEMRTTGRKKNIFKCSLKKWATVNSSFFFQKFLSHATLGDCWDPASLKFLEALSTPIRFVWLTATRSGMVTCGRSVFLWGQATPFPISISNFWNLLHMCTQY